MRRTRHRLAAIERRIEVLDGYLLVYLNLDEVIRIIREEEEPKPRLMARFELSEVQAESILNMRLRSLRKLEEMEIRKEHRGLTKERRDIQALLKDEGSAGTASSRSWRRRATKFGGGKLGARRTEIGAAPPAVEVTTEGFVEREPLTVVLSDKGWIRAFKGHLDDGCRAALQGRRQAEAAAALPDHRPADAVRHQRARLHAEAGRPAARARRRAAGAPAGRADQRGRRGRAVRAERRRENTWWRPRPGAALSCRARNCRPKSAPASRC